MIRKTVADLVTTAAQELQGAGELGGVVLPEVVLERPKEKAHGDLATNIALVLAGQSELAPREIAQRIAEKLSDKSPFIAKIEVAGPGFINFFLSRDWLYQVLTGIYEEKDYQKPSNVGKGLKVQVEFVSANPVGPLHVGHGRWAAVGDTLATLLQRTGHAVSREFYVNDVGSQMRLFGLSVSARYCERLGKETPFPEDGYHGRYVSDLAGELVDEQGDKYLKLSDAERASSIEEWAYKRMLAEIRETLEMIEVRFDHWFSERQLHESGAVFESIAELEKRGYVYQEDGARWLRTTAFGDDKDRVLIRENGEPTYFASDIAYHKNKLDRGFKRLLDVWGADHHGYAPRVAAALEALGYEDVLEVVIGQLVSLWRGGEQVRMSKRTGEIITLRELLDEVGKDAARFFFLMRSTDSALDFDLELAKSESQENPVYYVQYAHARIASILRYAQAEGVSLPKDISEAELERLDSESELELLKTLAQFKETVEKAAHNRAPHYLTRYAQDVAAAFHVFYTNCRVIGVDARLSQARLILVLASQRILRETLKIIGVSAPEKM